MSKYLEGLQFVGSVVLVVATSTVALLNSPMCGVASFRQMQRSVLGNTTNRNLNIKLGQEIYQLRPRLLLWLRQLALFSFVLVYLYTTVLAPGEQLSSKNNKNDSYLSSETTFVHYGTPVLYILSLLVVIYFDGMNNLAHQSARQSWLLVYAILCGHSVVNFYVSRTASLLALLLLSMLTLIFAVVCSLRDECYDQVNPPTDEYTSNLFDYITFKHLNRVLIIPGMKKASFEFETDVPSLSDADSIHELWATFRALLLSEKELTLWYSLYQLVKYEWLAQGFFQLIGASSTYITPLALERILLHIANHGSDDDSIKTIIPISVEMAMLMLFLGPLLSCICDNQNYLRGRYVDAMLTILNVVQNIHFMCSFLNFFLSATLEFVCAARSLLRFITKLCLST